MPVNPAAGSVQGKEGFCGQNHRGGTLTAMTFRPESLRGAGVGTSGAPVDYRLARSAVVAQFQKGRLDRNDVCDAHPELLRAARNIGEVTAIDCPICEQDQVVLISYLFGGRLPPGGTVVSNAKELRKAVGRGTDPVTCYVVEVCPSCSWNHLAQVLPVKGKRRAS